MTTVERRDQLSVGEIRSLQRLLDAATAVDGVTPLDEGRWREVHQGKGFVGLLVRTDGDRLAGYAHLGHARNGWSLAAVVHPDTRLDGGPVTDALAHAVTEVVKETGSATVTLWASQPRPDHERLAARLGLRAGRALYQMRRPLPVGEPFELETRPFRPGKDEARWLEVNNRAFAWHPEQGDWDPANLEAHEALPWFDPAGFLLHDVDGEMAGFCWTKIHAEVQPPLGEIYVIATDPNFAGQGLGRRLTLAGLDHLARSGIDIGMLYVDADNVRAVKLYVDLGFVVHHVDVNFEGIVE